MRAAVADHAAIVQSGAIATTPCSRLSNNCFASMARPRCKTRRPVGRIAGATGPMALLGSTRVGTCGLLCQAARDVATTQQPVRAAECLAHRGPPADGVGIRQLGG